MFSYGVKFISEFGVQEVRDVCTHFKETLHRANPDFDEEDALDELRLLKKLLQERYCNIVHADLMYSNIKV